MDYGDYYWGLYRDYYRDPFPHSLLSTRQFGGFAGYSSDNPHLLQPKASKASGMGPRTDAELRSSYLDPKSM